VSVFGYLIRHADDNLILSHRLSEWVSRGPELEEDIALANIALDHLGVARALYGYASEVEGMGRHEDDIAMLRTEREYTNLLLTEQPNGDFAQTMVRQALVDAYQLSLWEALSTSTDTTLGGIAAKALKEARYHFRHSSLWLVRLGDGTDESHMRAQKALNKLWRYVPELFESDATDREMVEAGVGADPAAFRPAWDDRIQSTVLTATLDLPDDIPGRSGGRQGFHTEYLGHILAELQWMQRTYPGARW